MNPPISQQITFLYSNDLSRAAEFYEQTMGFSLWRDQGTCRIYHIHGNAYVGICQRKEAYTPPQEPRTLILTLVTDDVDGWYNTLQARGVAFEKAPAVNPTYNIYHCFLRDPDGHLIEIQTFLV